MNIKKIGILSVVATCFLFSCNKQVTYADAIKYVESNYTETEAPTPKSGKITWDFQNTDESYAKVWYNSLIKFYVKDTPDYKVSGEGEMNDTGLENISKKYFINKDSHSILIDNDEYYTYYTNSKGLKCLMDSSVLSNTMQWNKKGGILQFNYHRLPYGEDTTEYTYSYSLTY